MRSVDVVRSRTTTPAREREQRGLPVDWDLARRTAARLVAPGPPVAAQEAAELVALLREKAVVAEQHVRELTGLGKDLAIMPADVVDRPGWAAAAVTGMAALTAGARLPAPPPLARAVTATTAGLQVGGVLAYLGTRVLGQYDPFGGRTSNGRLLLVAPNVHAAQRALDVPVEDFAMWVCLHEATHRLQFTAVPWLRSFFAEQVARFLSVPEDHSGSLVDRLPDAVRLLRSNRRDALGLVEVLQGPQQRALLDQLLALTTLLEGHADHVMDAVGPRVVPSVATIRARFTARRRGGGLIDRLLRVLLGVEAKVRQYAIGSAFTAHVVREAGMEGFNRVWESPRTLPSRAELSDPAAWLRRMEREGS